MCNKCLTEKHAGVIYALHNGDHNYRYYGRTENYKSRFGQHLRDARKGSTIPVHKWIREEGPENIHLVIIESFTSDELDNMGPREVYHIEQARATNPDNLNKHRGTIASLTPEARANISKAHMGNKNALGFVHTEETRARMSEAKLGEKHHNWGKPVSEEQKAKSSAKQKGRANRGPHTTWHTNKGRVSRVCEYCIEDAKNVNNG